MNETFDVTVQVLVRAKTKQEAQDRVEKALVCLDNSLAYCLDQNSEVVR